MKYPSAPGPTRWVCPGCGYDLEPRMSRFRIAEHKVQHREAAVMASKVRGRKVPTREWVELVDLYRVYVSELRGDRQRLRARVRDLEDEVDAQTNEVGQRDQVIAELYADLDRDLG